MFKIDLKDTYFAVPLTKNSQKYARFQWKGNLYEFSCLCFGLSSAPRIFTKLMNMPISVLKKLCIRIMIYLDDMLLKGATLKELITAPDTLICLLQSLGFLINIQKPIEPHIEFLGLAVNFQDMTFSLPKEKNLKIQGPCKEIQPSTSIRTLIKLQAQLQYKALEHKTIT